MQQNSPYFWFVIVTVMYFSPLSWTEPPCEIPTIFETVTEIDTLPCGPCKQAALDVVNIQILPQYQILVPNGEGYQIIIDYKIDSVLQSD